MGSMLYGYTWKGYLKRDPEGNMVYRTASGYPGLYKTKVMDVYPHLEYVFKEFQELYFPEFNYTSDYTGGELVVEGFQSDGSDAVVDNKNSIFQFNGAKFYHWVKPFQGKRYSLVFFSNKAIARKMNS